MFCINLANGHDVVALDHHLTLKEGVKNNRNDCIYYSIDKPCAVKFPMSEYKLILCNNFQSKITGFVKMVGLEKFNLKPNITVMENILKTKVNGNSYTCRYSDTYTSFWGDMSLKKSGKINCSITNLQQNIGKFHSFYDMQMLFSKPFKGEIVMSLQEMYKRPSYYRS